MKLRLKKKRGLLRGPSDRKLKEIVRNEMETEARILEQRSSRVKLPGEL